MDIFRTIARRKIEEAMEEGEFDDLPLRGQRIDLGDLDHLPEEERLAGRVLKNANVLPEELQLRKEVRRLRDALRECTDEERRQRLLRQLNAKEAGYNLLMERRR